jgi:hypothetical protein
MIFVICVDEFGRLSQFGRLLTFRLIEDEDGHPLGVERVF